MTSDEYVASRLAPEIDYYDRRAGENKMLFRAVSLLAIAAAAAVPVLAAADFERWAIAAAGLRRERGSRNTRAVQVAGGLATIPR